MSTKKSDDYKYIVYIGNDYVKYEKILQCCSSREEAMLYIADNFKIVLITDKSGNIVPNANVTIEYYYSDDYIFTRYVGIEKVPCF